MESPAHVEGVLREMRVFHRRHHRLVAEQPGDCRQALADRQRLGGEGVTDIRTMLEERKRIAQKIE